MPRWWCILATVVALAMVGIAAALGLFAVRSGISARDEPSRLEASVARSLRNGLIPSSVREIANPIPPSPRALAEGRAHFADHCAVCHANDGSGDTRIGRGLYPRAPDMRARATQDLADGELFYIIENGVRLTGMPAWGGPGTAEGSWHLVHFIRHLPRLTDEEKAQMEAANPKSPDEWRALHEEAEFLRTGKAPSTSGTDAHAH